MPLFDWNKSRILDTPKEHYWFYWAITAPLTVVTITIAITWATWQARITTRQIREAGKQNEVEKKIEPLQDPTPNEEQHHPDNSHPTGPATTHSDHAHAEAISGGSVEQDRLIRSMSMWNNRMGRRNESRDQMEEQVLMADNRHAIPFGERVKGFWKRRRRGGGGVVELESRDLEANDTRVNGINHT